MMSRIPCSMTTTRSGWNGTETSPCAVATVTSLAVAIPAVAADSAASLAAQAVSAKAVNAVIATRVGVLLDVATGIGISVKIEGWMGDVDVQNRSRWGSDRNYASATLRYYQHPR